MTDPLFLECRKEHNHSNEECQFLRDVEEIVSHELVSGTVKTSPEGLDVKLKFSRRTSFNLLASIIGNMVLSLSFLCMSRDFRGQISWKFVFLILMCFVEPSFSKKQEEFADLYRLNEASLVNGSLTNLITCSTGSTSISTMLPKSYLPAGKFQKAGTLKFCSGESGCERCLNQADCPSCSCTTEDSMMVSYISCLEPKTIEFASETVSGSKNTGRSLLFESAKLTDQKVICGSSVLDKAKTKSGVPKSCHGQKVVGKGFTIDDWDSCPDEDSFIQRLKMGCENTWMNLVIVVAFYLVVMLILNFLSKFLKVAAKMILILSWFFVNLKLITANSWMILFRVIRIILSSPLELRNFLFKKSESEGKVEDSSKKNSIWVSKTVFPKKDPVLLALIMVVSLADSQSCSSLIVGSDVSMLCQRVNNVETCNVTTSVTVPVSLGTKTCLSLIDPTNSFRRVDYELSLSSLWHSHFRVNQYHTTKSVDLVRDSIKKCYSTGNCGADSCNREEDKLRNPFSMFTSDVITYPGRTECFRVCGCASCGCFYCNDACLWCALGVKPGTVQVKVSELGSPKLQFEMIIKETNAEVKNSSSIILKSYDAQGSLGTISVVSSLNIEAPFVPISRTCTTSGREQFCDASPINSPKCGELGMIQSSFPITPLSKTFNLDQTCIVTQDTANTCSYSMITRTGRFLDLPGTYSSYKYTSEIGGIKQFLNAGSLSVNLVFPGTLTFSRLTELACPEFITPNTYSIEGCYSCSAAATLKIKLFSTCGDGTAILTTEPAVGILVSKISLESTGKEFSLGFLYNKKIVNFKLIVNSNKVLNIEGTLEDPQETGNETSTTTPPGEEENSFSVTRGLAIGLTIPIIAIVIAVVIFFCLCPVNKLKSN